MTYEDDIKDEKVVSGDKINTLTTFERLRTALANMLRGYPTYWYWGIIEYYFEGKSKDVAVKTLKKDKLIEFASKEKSKELNKNLTSEQRKQLKLEGKKEPKYYRLTEKGVSAVTALINQKHSEEVSNYNKRVLSNTQETQKFNRITQILTIIMTFLTAGLFALGILQLIATYSQSNSVFVDIFIKNIIP